MKYKVKVRTPSRTVEVIIYADNLEWARAVAHAAYGHRNVQSINACET